MNRFRPARRQGACVAAATLLAAQLPTFAGMEWQLVDPGVPLSGIAVQLFHMSSTGTTFLRIEDRISVPQLWTLEGDRWVRRLETSYPPQRFKAALAYDPGRDVVVRFGGDDSELVPYSETWEFDGSTWTQRTDVGAPPPRSRAAMAYDTERGIMVLFGGFTGTTALEDTWEYDGVQWRERNHAVHPPARFNAIMSYDAKRRNMVLAFGQSTAVGYDDTWEYDGTRWTKPNVHSPPAAKWEAASAYDPIRRAVYVFDTNAAGDTLRWTGSAWDVVPASTRPPGGRHAAAMTFDASRGKVLLYGGYYRPMNIGDTWEWDGSNWTEIPIGPDAAKRATAGAAFDPVAERAVLFGGCCEGMQYDVAEWDGAQWALVPASPNPGRVGSPAVAASPGDRVLSFGGFRVNDRIDETWTYDASLDVWTQRFPGTRPEARSAAGMVFSPAHGGFVLFGGAIRDTVGNDTWLYSGGDWTEILSPVRPTRRQYFGMAADTARGTVVVYGGAIGNGLADTWILTGGAWAQSPAIGPGVRIGPAMAFDAERGVSVLAGGLQALDPLQRTWEFDGQSWTPRTTTYSPDAARQYGTMFWDPTRRVCVLTGGDPWADGTYSDTWAYGPDDDGDLRVGGYDNCPQAANADQADADGDAAGDVCDCAATDPTAFASPQPVTGLTLSGGGATSLSWNDQSSAVGSGVRYDAASGALSTLRAGSIADATCLASQTAVTSASDSRTPATDDGYWYLVRARNVCGIGTFGVGSLDAASPCP